MEFNPGVCVNYVSTEDCSLCCSYGLLPSNVLYLPIRKGRRQCIAMYNCTAFMIWFLKDEEMYSFHGLDGSISLFSLNLYINSCRLFLRNRQANSKFTWRCKYVEWPVLKIKEDSHYLISRFNIKLEERIYCGFGIQT